jgi:hypothetical protein
LLDLDGTANGTDDGLIDFHGTADANLEGLLDFDGTEDIMDNSLLDSNSDGMDKGIEDSMDDGPLDSNGLDGTDNGLLDMVQQMTALGAWLNFFWYK